MKNKSIRPFLIGSLWGLLTIVGYIVAWAFSLMVIGFFLKLVYVMIKAGWNSI